jgi:peptide/nickel transport system substrate-binding protein
MGCIPGARLDVADDQRSDVSSRLRSARAPGSAALARVYVALLAVVLIALTGCGAAGVAPGSASGGLTSLRIATSFAINNLDPLQNGFWGSEMGFGDLLMKPDGNGKLSPWLLQSLARTSPDVWTLTLRPRIRFQNGDPLNAAALAQTMNYMLANNTALEPELPGAKVTATGPLTVTLATARPTASVPSLLANEAMFDIFDTPVYLRLKANPASLVAARIYTGPYMVTSLTPQQMAMKPNPYYYGPKPKLQQLTILFIADPQARIDAVERGEADLALYPPEAAARQLRDSSQAYFLTQQPSHAYGGFQLVMNFRSGPLSDVAVRKAIQHGINYQQISQQVMGGYYDTPVGLYPASLPYALHDQTTDIALARSELQNDGWVPGSGGIRVKDGQPLQFTVLTYPQQPDTAPIALAMQSQLRAIGISMQIRQVDDIDTVVQQPTGWQAALDGDTAMDWTDSDPIEPLIANYTTSGDDNYGGINDPQINQIAAELEASTSTSQTDVLLEQAQRIIVVQNAWSIFVSYKRDAAVASPQLRDYVVPPAALLWTNAYA